nr:thiamine phosphate synthase [Caldanaerobacter subterraneus]
MVVKGIDLTLYAITDRFFIKGMDIAEAVEIAIKNGVTVVQLREKDISSREFYEIALKVKEVTRKYNVPLIINDRVDIALAVDAEGVHVGPDDLPVGVVRRILGPDKIVGGSAYSVEEALKAEKEGADYIGAGSVFAQPVKPEAEVIGIEGVRKIKEAVNIPVVAIGGVNKTNAYEVILHSGVDGISAIAGIFDGDIEANTKDMLREIRRAFKERGK